MALNRNGSPEGSISKKIVTTKGDLITATANAIPSRLAAGSDGDTLVTDSATSTGLRYSSMPGDNLLANGSFDIWQRGTSGFTGNQSYTADRWFVYSSATFSISQETSVVPDGATNALKVNVTSANGYANLQYAMEQSDVQKLRGKTITFSVYLRADATYNGSFNMSIQSNTTGNTQTGGTWSTVTGASTTHTPSTSAFTRVSVTGTVPTNANGLSFYIGQNAVLANNSNYYIALAKAEIGSVATTWSRAGGGTLQGELAACQRYYFRNTADQVYGSMATGFATASTGGLLFLQMPVQMRVTPTALEYANLRCLDSGFGGTLTSLSLTTNECSKTVAEIALSGTGYTTHRPIWLSANFNAAGYVAVTAEL